MRFHKMLLDEAETFLVNFAPELCEMKYLPETESKWLRLAKHFEEASQAIKALMQYSRSQNSEAQA